MTNPTPTNAAASYYGQTDSIQSWLDQNLGSYLEQNPGVIQANRLLGGAGAGFCPPGSILSYGAATAPTGWVLCDGTTYDGTIPTYLNLWTAIGVTYGGTGQSSFIVPDLRGRVIAGFAPSGGHSDVSALGNTESTGTTAVVQANRRPRHDTTDSLSISGAPALTGSVSLSGTVYPDSATVNLSAGGGATTLPNPPSGAVSITNSLAVTKGTLALSGAVGASGTNSVDAPAYLVLATIIKL